MSAIEREIASWPGVSVGPHRFGGIEFRVGRRELGRRRANILCWVRSLAGRIKCKSRTLTGDCTFP
ncbi:MAG: DUF5519 family protein [Acidobacteria bacterium]|nr:DUF5519 family protein [Acidobacteriota bacterium]